MVQFSDEIGQRGKGVVGGDGVNGPTLFAPMSYSPSKLYEFSGISCSFKI